MDETFIWDERTAFVTEGTRSRKTEYAEYLKSEKWDQLSSARMAQDNHRCVMCNEPSQVVHHRCYPEVFGMESLDDLVSLCNRCHHNHHKPPSLDIVRKQLFDEAEKGNGTKCPCCDHLVKYYKRKLNSIMARTMVYVFRWYRNHDRKEWIDMPQYLSDPNVPSDLMRGHEYPRLCYWGLLEKKFAKNTGMYRLTDLGEEFVKGLITVPGHVVISNKVVVGFSSKTIGIHRALGEHFDYEELMRGDLDPVDDYLAHV